MKLRKVEYVLNDMIRHAGLSPKNPDLSRYLAVLREYARIPTSCELDTWWFFSEVNNASGLDCFNLFFVRIMKPNEDSRRHVHLCCYFDYGQVPELFGMKMSILSSRMKSSDEFFDYIENSEEITTLVRRYTPKSCHVMKSTAHHGPPKDAA